jgi:hypothetical protein
MGRILHVNYSDLLIGVYALTLISVGYLVWVARLHRGAGTMDDGPRQYKPGDWEKLPEIISLRAKRRPYQLLGDVSVASPFFEISLIVLIVGVIAGTVSYPVDLSQYFARVPATAPVSGPALMETPMPNAQEGLPAPSKGGK